MRERLFVSRHRIWQIAIDAVLVSVALIGAYALRFDFDIPRAYWHQLLQVIVPIMLVQLAVFVLLGMYNKWWRYSGVRDLASLFWGTLAGVALSMIVGELVVHYLQTPIYGRWHNVITADFLPRSVIALDWVLCFGLMGGARMLSRIAWERPWREELSRDRKKVLVVGAGDAGELVVREMQKTRRIRYRPVGFVDDDHKKKNLRIHGVRVVGTTRHLPALIEEYAVDEVIIAMPSVSGRLIEDIAMSCKKANVPVKTLPGVYELIKGSVTIEQLREVQVEDILGRHEVSVDYNSIGYIAGKVVMVTGAGGSIGSELSRQLAAMGPRLLVLVDHSEGNLFQIENELETERHFTALVACLLDIRDKVKLRALFESHRPDIVFHAAAYKHVPMMQNNPAEAFDNNSFGTMSMIENALRFGTGRLVFISTDKAVEPETVMGLSKALSERIVETMAREATDTRLMTVRFRQRTRLQRQRRAAVQAPDRRRRAGDGDRRAHDPLLHDHPRSGAARHPGRGHRRRRRDLCARHGRAHADRRPGTRDDQAVGPRTRPRYRDRLHRQPRRRKARREALQRRRAGRGHDPPQDRHGRPPAAAPGAAAAGARPHP